MVLKRKARKAIAVGLFLLMLISSFPAFAAGSVRSAPLSTAKDQLRKESAKKMDRNWVDSLPDGEYGEAIVYLKSQTNGEEAAREARTKLSSALTPNKAKTEVRKAVINALKDNAEDTQRNLVKYLSQQKGKGKVKEYKAYYIVNVVYVKAAKDVLEDISYFSEVEKIYENKIVKLDKPEINKSKIQANANGVEWNIERIKADAAWDLGVDGTGVVVGTIDSGATWQHPALQAKWRGYLPDDPGSPNPDGNWFDAVNGSALPNDDASSPHGTHVLGTILGQEPDGSNKVGAAPGAKWIAAKAFSPIGGYDDDILEAAEWMMAPGGDPEAAPDIINNSWGGGPGMDEWFRSVVVNWRAAGILPVFSAGNEEPGKQAPPASVSSPANYPESFAAGALDNNNKKADFSQRGPGPYDNLKPEVSAPGVNIRSSVPGGYESGWSGTSMSAPAVTGTAALVLSANHSLSVEDVEDLLKDTATPLEDANDSGHPNNGYGYGLVDAFEAVSSVAGGAGTIEGKVLAEGQDLENPVIVHEQEVFDAYLGSDIEIQAEISDDVSIVDTELLVKGTEKFYWITLPMTRTAGDHKSGTYTGTVPADVIEQPGFTYKIKARDYDGNVVATEGYQVKVKFGVVPDQYETDFEVYPTGWVMDGDWQWGEPAESVGPAPLSGTKLIGTNLGGNYSNSGDSVLLSVPLDLRNPDLTFAQFRVSQWYDMENNFDKGFVYVTNDYGETWTQAGPVYTGTQTEWKEILIDLNPYIGSKDPVFLAFRMTTDASDQRAGWYLDDAKLIATDNISPATPANVNGKFRLNGVTLNWDAVLDADVQNYRVYRSDAEAGDYDLLGETDGTSYGDRDVAPETAYYYKVSACDFAGNESELSSSLAVEVPAFGDHIFLADFKEDNGDFTTGGENNTWEWGVPTSGPEAGFYGEKVWATGLSGNYVGNSNCWIESPEIQLPEENCFLAIGQWYELENRYDKGYIQIAQQDGENWSEWADIAPGDYLTGDGKAWADLEIPLDSSYAGKTVKVRFLLTSDSSVSKAGWYLDYVLIDASGEAGKAAKTDKPKGKIRAGLNADSISAKKESEVKPFQLDLKAMQKTKADKYKTIPDQKVSSPSSVTAGLPVDASVTVLETGRSVKTNPADGRFQMKHAASKGNESWTLKAEAYGFYPAETKVHLNENQTVKTNFVLEAIPKGTITGRVVDRYSGDPAANATVRVLEDPRVPVATADENGEFTIPDIYEGEYTLKAVADGFEPGEIHVVAVGKETVKTEIPLKRFVGYEEEIAYDDGTGENALVLNAAGNGLAIRVTPAQFGLVKGANIFFWGNDWPTPGGSKIGITLYDSDADGNPVKLDVQPKIVDVVRGEWNNIDLSEFGFSTDRDFFIATCQTDVGTLSPGTGIDESSPYAERSYLYSGDTFTPIKEEDVTGGLMIRARMEYSVGTPEISNLEDTSYTNEDSVVVEGTVTADSKVNIYGNGARIGEVNSEGKKFHKEVVLPEDETLITATAELSGKETEPSAGKTVIKDKIAPELMVISPKDGLVTKDRVVDVTGTVSDDHFGKLEINDEAVEVTNGAFHAEKIVQQGENLFHIRAYDLAGNQTESTVRVVVKKDAPVITDLEPSEDMYLPGGGELTVSFHSEPGGQGRFRILIPGSAATQSNRSLAMEEVEAGYYVGKWTAPDARISGLVVEAEFMDVAGNTVTAEAAGKIQVGVDENAIRDLKPSEDVTLKGGEQLTVSFRSGKGGSASFRMVFPGLSALKPAASNMREVTPGYYEGAWTAPQNTKANGLMVEVTYTDADGKKATATAPGRIHVVESGKEKLNPLKPKKPGK